MVMSYYEQPEGQFGYFNPRQEDAFHRGEYFDPERIRGGATDTASPAQDDGAFPVPGVWGM